MNKTSKPPARTFLVGILALVGCLALGFVVFNSRVLPVRISFRYEPVIVPGSDIWVSALHKELPPEAFEEVVKAHPEERDSALELFAYNNMTNYVRILIRYGVRTSDERLGVLRNCGSSNAAALIASVMREMRQTSNVVARTNASISQ